MSMDEQREQELRAQVEQETRMLIARKMREEGVSIELIAKYTGVRLEERRLEDEAYDLAAKQVAAEMLMRGLSVSTVQIATRLPYEVVMELKQQYAGFFGEEESE